MMGLGPALGRQRAHDLVYDICRAGDRRPGRRFLDLLAAHPEIAPHMRREELAGWSIRRTTGPCGEMVDRVLALQQAGKA